MDPTNHPAAEFLRGRASRFLAPLLDPVADLILMAMRPMTRHCAVMAVALSMAWAGGGHRVEADAAETMGESVLDLRENHISEGFGRHIYIILYTPLDDSTFNTSIFSLFFHVDGMRTTETWPGYPESDEDQIRKLLGEMTTEAAWTAWICVANHIPRTKRNRLAQVHWICS